MDKLKLLPNPLVRTGTDIKLWPIGLIQKQIYVNVNVFKLSFSRFFAWPVETFKSGLMTI